MNSIGGCILEQVYCPPTKERHNSDSMDTQGGFLQHLKESFYHISDAFSSRRSFSDMSETSENTHKILNNMPTAGLVFGFTVFRYDKNISDLDI